MNAGQASGDVPPDVPRVAAGQAVISGALLLGTVTALTAVAGHRRSGGRRGATHARRSRRPAAPAPPRTPAPHLAPAPSDGTAGVLERVRPEVGQVRPGVRYVQPGNGQVRDAGSVQLAAWIIAEARQQATEIRHGARDHAAASLAGARQEAAELMRQAAERAAATLATAEREAAAARAQATMLSAIAAEPAVKPKATPRSRAANARTANARTANARTANARVTAAKPPAAKAAAIPAANPDAVPRQILAGRVMGIIVLVFFMVALLAGTSEVARHGFRFFVFRPAGTGETSSHDLPAAPGGRQQPHNP